MSELLNNLAVCEGHKQMVTDLCKNGDDIVMELDREKAHLWHMATSVSGEAGEILSAIYSGTPTAAIDRDNLLEEMGDIEFYLEGYRQGIHFSRDEILTASVTIKNPIAPTYLGIELAIQASHLLDATKKFAIYNNGLKSDKVIQALRNLEYCMEGIRADYNIGYEQCLSHNHDKLLSGTKARYKEGTYSNDQANDRADKK